MRKPLSSLFAFRWFLLNTVFCSGLLLLLSFSCHQQTTTETNTTTTTSAVAAADTLQPADTVAAAAPEMPQAVPDSVPGPALQEQAAAKPETHKPDNNAPAVRDTSTMESRVVGPKPLPGSILPYKRIVAYYGNPLSKRMGVLGEYPVDEMLAMLDTELRNWEKADPTTPVQPALHLVAVTAQGQPGKDGMYRQRMSNALIDKVLAMAEKRDALVFLDIQVGRSTLQQELPRLEKYLQMPHVHLGVDAEFAMGADGVPGKRIGSFDAADINYAAGYLAELVTKHNIPPKVFVVHRFTQPMIRNASQIKLDPRVQIVMHMDGWGDKPLKRDSYRRYIVREPVQYTGFKLFYKNDVRKPGWSLMTPQEILKLKPKPIYIQYQ